jgi:hypothetical protein
MRCLIALEEIRPFTHDPFEDSIERWLIRPMSEYKHITGPDPTAFKKRVKREWNGLDHTPSHLRPSAANIQESVISFVLGKGVLKSGSQ